MLGFQPFEHSADGGPIRHGFNAGEPAEFKDCQEVRKLGVCNYDKCNLAQMEREKGQSSDSGGPIYWGRAVYGFYQGAIFDPWPMKRDIWSRADFIGEALGTSIATD